MHTLPIEKLLDAIGGDARLVLLGELTQALIRERGFTHVAVEADWPDADRANRWVRGISKERGPEAALEDFTRFPRWMWCTRHLKRRS